MPDSLKSLEEVTKLIKQFSRNLVNISLTNMDCQEQVFALKSVLFSLDSRAQSLFDEQWKLEHYKHEKERSELRTLLETMQSYFPERTN